MKITFVLANLDTSGGLRVISTYARELKQRGHDIVIVARGPSRPLARQRLVSALRGKPFWRTPARPHHLQDSGLDVRILKRRRPVLNDDLPDADVLIATWWETANWVEAAFPAKGAKVHFVQHYEAFAPEMKEPVDRVLALAMPKIVIATWLKGLLKERGAADIALIPNAIDTRKFFASHRRKQHVPTVGMLYHNIGWKGTDVGLRAINILRARIPDLRLIAFGHTEIDPRLPLPPGSEYFRLPDQKLLRQIYAKADAWLSPSWSEGFGLPTFEAMACGTPAVATKTGGAVDFIWPGHNGYLSEPGDAESLAANLERILSLDQEHWAQMSNAALDTIADYTIEESVDLFEEALARAARGEPIAPASRSGSGA